MSSRVTDAFIEASYEDYKKKAGDLFGKGLFGVFSDEPQTARYATPWSIDLPELFQARYGYSPVSYTHLDVYKRQAANRRR